VVQGGGTLRVIPRIAKQYTSHIPEKSANSHRISSPVKKSA
jgi:hypothetical protein